MRQFLNFVINLYTLYEFMRSTDLYLFIIYEINLFKIKFRYEKHEMSFSLG